jgi:hypothetical protein
MNEQPSRKLNTFRIGLGLGIIVNLGFAIPAFFAPHVLNNVLGLEPSRDPIWIHNVGMLLVGICLIYLGFFRASEVNQHVSFSLVTARFVATLFWSIVACTKGGILWGFFAADLIVALVLLVGYLKLPGSK